MKTIGVIPARYASSRFPGKPLADICGKPMIWWVYQQCLKVPGLDNVLVATEDNRIVDVCKQYGLSVRLTSAQHPTGTDRLCEVAESVPADFYVNIQGDEPLIESATIQAVIDCFYKNTNMQVINTMTKIKNEDELHSDTVVKVAASENGRLLYLSRSLIPHPKNKQAIDYYKHMGLYGLTKSAVTFYHTHARGRIECIEDIEMFRFLENGQEVLIIEVNSQTIAVDRPEDICKVEVQLKKRNIV